MIEILLWKIPLHSPQPVPPPPWPVWAPPDIPSPPEPPSPASRSEPPPYGCPCPAAPGKTAPGCYISTKKILWHCMLWFKIKRNIFKLYSDGTFTSFLVLTIAIRHPRQGQLESLKCRAYTYTCLATWRHFNLLAIRSTPTNDLEFDSPTMHPLISSTC